MLLLCLLDNNYYVQILFWAHVHEVILFEIRGLHVVTCTLSLVLSK